MAKPTKSAAPNTVDYSVRDGIAVVALNRPDVRNAVNETLRAELYDIIEQAGHDEKVRALVLTGNGPGFCAGGDISAMSERFETPIGEGAMKGWKIQHEIHQLIGRLHDFDKPTVAAVNGAAAGLGCDLALCCDFIVAADNAFFIMSYVLRGLIPDGGGLYFLPRRVGLPRAKELIFSGRRVDAAEALEIGMADHVVPADNLLDEAKAFAARMSASPLSAISLSKAILNKTFEVPASETFALGAQAQAICYTTDEHRNAVREFLESRKR